MYTLIAALSAIAAFLPASAHAARADDLAALAQVFGGLHHVRRMCEPRRESELWRERMKQLVRLEQPTAQLRRRLVGSFNAGYRDAEGAFSQCDDAAEAYAERQAALGLDLSTRLSK